MRLASIRGLTDCRAVGDRVLTATEGFQNSTSGIAWRKIDLEMSNPRYSGDVYRISLLQPESWELHGWTPGKTVRFVIEGLELAGEAKIRAVRPCPPIASGAGRVVTMTVRAQVWELNAETACSLATAIVPSTILEWRRNHRARFRNSFASSL
ncbi:MAG: hypothetical protein KDN22_28515 [Verrucomicrobiae bacterium]|nr:hypothetical protein [Verrucomicrobiae bacterium]